MPCTYSVGLIKTCTSKADENQLDVEDKTPLAKRNKPTTWTFPKANNKVVL